LPMGAQAGLCEDAVPRVEQALAVQVPGQLTALGLQYHRSNSVRITHALNKCYRLGP
jgi:hypothetical protein